LNWVLYRVSRWSFLLVLYNRFWTRSFDVMFMHCHLWRHRFLTVSGNDMRICCHLHDIVPITV
jgi:hypothetical protein